MSLRNICLWTLMSLFGVGLLCDGTLRKRVCGFAYCVEDTPDGEGYWYCDECRGYKEEDEDFDFRRREN